MIELEGGKIARTNGMNGDEDVWRVEEAMCARLLKPQCRQVFTASSHQSA